MVRVEHEGSKPDDNDKAAPKHDEPPKPVVYGMNEPQTVTPGPELDVSILKNRPVKTEDELNHGDTIYIDKEGNLKLMNDAQDDKAKAEKEAANTEN